MIHLIIIVLLAGVFCWLIFKFSMLSKDGAVAAFFIGVVVLGMGGWKACIPLLAFFVSSSFLGKLKSVYPNGLDRKAGKPRDAIQVISNGGIPFVLIILFFLTGFEAFLLAYMAVLATATSDTWSSEIGVRYGGTPYDFLSLKRLPVGVSGGITGVGLLAGISGSFFIAVLAAILYPEFSLIKPGLIGITGILGNFFDSFLGSQFQIKYFHSRTRSYLDKKIDEDNSPQVKGVKWINNDMVNLLSAVFSAALILGLLMILKKFNL